MPLSAHGLSSHLLLSATVTSSLSAVGVGAQQQTPVQREVCARWQEPARKASAEAASETELLFANPATTRYLRELDDGSGLFKMTPQQLASRFWKEVSSAELIHNFGDGASAGANCGYDLTIQLGRDKNRKTFPNQWQLQVSGEMPVDAANNYFTEYSEVGLFGFPGFANASAPDKATADSRPVYGAVNLYRSSGGNPQCGAVAAVLSRSAVAKRTNALVTPVDTGFFNGACRGNGTVGKMGNTTMAVCSAWPEPRTLGVPGSDTMQHMLAPYLHFYNVTQSQAGADYPYLNLARLTIRLLSRETFKANIQSNGEAVVHLNWVENTLGYFEMNPAVAVSLQGGVKMLIGMFELLFGTSEGEELRAWCQEKGWPLAWAYNPEQSFFRCGPAGDYPECTFPESLDAPSAPVNVRLLDPLVLRQVGAGHNVSLPPDVHRFFEEQWNATNATSASKAELAQAWARLMGSGEKSAWNTLAVEPVYADACESDDCVGVQVATGHCVCPKLDGDKEGTSQVQDLGSDGLLSFQTATVI